MGRQILQSQYQLSDRLPSSHGTKAPFATLLVSVALPTEVSAPKHALKTVSSSGHSFTLDPPASMGTHCSTRLNPFFVATALTLCQPFLVSKGFAWRVQLQSAASAVYFSCMRHIKPKSLSSISSLRLRRLSMLLWTRAPKNRQAPVAQRRAGPWKRKAISSFPLLVQDDSSFCAIALYSFDPASLSRPA